MPGSKLRYRDALGGWSAPANNPGLKYYDAKAQWSVPSKNPKLKYRDALGQWSAPAVEAPSIGDMSWEALSALANAAAANPDEYQQYVGEERYVNFTKSGIAKTILVGVGQDETQYGGKTGFTFWVQNIGSFDRVSVDWAGCNVPYAETNQGKYLDGLSIIDCPESLLVPHKVTYYYGHAGSEESEGLDSESTSYHRFSPLSRRNAGSHNSGGTYCPGEQYSYFNDNPCQQSGISGFGSAFLLDIAWSPKREPVSGIPEDFFKAQFNKQQVDYDATFSGVVILQTSGSSCLSTIKFCLGSYEG